MWVCQCFLIGGGCLAALSLYRSLVETFGLGHNLTILELLPRKPVASGFHVFPLLILSGHAVIDVLVDHALFVAVYYGNDAVVEQKILVKIAVFVLLVDIENRL